ncbi:hypothetical protein [Paenibacillus sp. CF384]|uniref:hypothetical protein n=1 Tax=Paenibacillus sp. CF384 TaxID=1884382 RepID=UPI0008993CEF|nr:hypothetical protein [Paenibacillus sp. CF384]SDX54383.1 hypothetical protein SAMN05518855_101613 [Paenibacillus sp. CF384]
MKVWKRGTAVLLVASLAFLAGCSSAASPKEAMMDAMASNQKATSMTYKGSMTFTDLVLPPAAADAAGSANSAMTATMLSFLKGTVINVHGSVQKSPMRAELTMDVTLGSGDVKLNASIPMIITEDKTWIKVPQIPGLPLPETIAGKFVEIDMKKLEQEQGAADVAASPQVGQDLLKALVDSLDEKTYFSEPEAADVKGLAADHKVDQLVRFSINEQNVEAAWTAIMEKAAPQIIDILLKNEAYMKLFKLTKSDLEAAKKELEGKEDGKVKAAVDEMKKSIKINQLDVTGGITDDYLTYEGLDMNIESTNSAQGMKLGIHFDLSLDDINKEIKFEYELPKDAVPVEKIQEMLGLPRGS